MPFDNRRISGPEETFSPSLFVEKKQKFHIVNSNKKRQNGRGLHDLRPMFLKVGVVNQARGSAYLEMEKTKIICSVYGPREIFRRQTFSSKGQVYCEFKFAPYSCAIRRQHQQDSEERELSSTLQEALESVICLHKFPKATVDVFVLVLENDGGALSGAITCVGAALSDAGIDMYDLIVGCSLRQYGKHTLLDPTSEEENAPIASNSLQNHGCITLGLMPSLQQVTILLQDGELDLVVVTKAIKLLMEGCHQIHPVVEECLLNSVKERLKETETEANIPTSLPS